MSAGHDEPKHPTRETAGNLEVIDARAADPTELACLFQAISGDPNFTPHPFDPEFIKWLLSYDGRDRYLVGRQRTGVLIAYGMLRGWDSGFEVPSLGIAVHPEARGAGVGDAMMHALHREAWAAGARSIRLRVHPTNSRAIRLYARWGYTRAGEERGQVVMLAHQPGDSMDTLGSLVDKLCTVDLKMWNNQELLYEIRRMNYDQFKAKYGQGEEGLKALWETLKRACDLNVQRNVLIDEIDERVIALVSQASSGQALDDGRNVQRKHKTY